MKIKYFLPVLLALFLIFFYSSSTNAFFTGSKKVGWLLEANWAAVDFYLRLDNKAVGFTAMGISHYAKLAYQISYSPANRAEQGIRGEVDITSNKMVKEWFDLGTDSSGDWVWDTGMDKIYLQLKLSGNGQDDYFIYKELDF